MRRLDWDKANAANRANRNGREPVYMAELPLSWREVFETIAPTELRPDILKFVRRVLLADIRGLPHPGVPHKLNAHLQKHVKRRGSVLKLAEWLYPREAVAAEEAKRLEHEKGQKIGRRKREKEREKDYVRSTLLHAAARRVLGLGAIDRKIIALAGAIGAEGEPSILAWAKSQPEFSTILKHKKRKHEKVKAETHRATNNADPDGALDRERRALARKKRADAKMAKVIVERKRSRKFQPP